MELSRYIETEHPLKASCLVLYLCLTSRIDTSDTCDNRNWVAGVLVVVVLTVKNGNKRYIVQSIILDEKKLTGFVNF